MEYIARENIKASGNAIKSVLVKFIEYKPIKAPKSLNKALAIIKAYPNFETAVNIQTQEISIIKFAAKIRKEKAKNIIKYLEEYIPNKELLENFFEELNLKPKVQILKRHKILFWLELF